MQRHHVQLDALDDPLDVGRRDRRRGVGDVRRGGGVGERRDRRGRPRPRRPSRSRCSSVSERVRRDPLAGVRAADEEHGRRRRRRDAHEETRRPSCVGLGSVVRVQSAGWAAASAPSCVLDLADRRGVGHQLASGRRGVAARSRANSVAALLRERFAAGTTSSVLRPRCVQLRERLVGRVARDLPRLVVEAVGARALEVEAVDLVEAQHRVRRSGYPYELHRLTSSGAGCDLTRSGRSPPAVAGTRASSSRPRHARVLDLAPLAQRPRQAREPGGAARELDGDEAPRAVACAAPSSQRRREPPRPASRAGSAPRTRRCCARRRSARGRASASSRRAGGRRARAARAARGSRRAPRGRRGRRPRSRGRSAPRSRRARRRRRAGRPAPRRARRTPGRASAGSVATAGGRAGACRRSRPASYWSPALSMRPVAALTSTLPSAHVRSSRGAAVSCASQSGAGVASEFRTHTHGARVAAHAAVGAAGEAVVAAELEHADVAGGGRAAARASRRASRCRRRATSAGRERLRGAARRGSRAAAARRCS